MEFNKAYNRKDFLSFLRVNFLPEDFQQETTIVDNPVQFQYTQQVTRLGECDSLGLVVYEVRHSSKHDARVGLTKEAFRLLADEFCERALVFFVPEDDASNYRFSLIEITLDQSEESSRVSRRYSNPHRYSYYLGKGIAYYTPNKYLNEYGRVVSVEDLRNRFSVEVLTRAFYQELSDWYAWAIMVVSFPNNLDTQEDNQKYNSEAMIRLITRLIFVWFLKQRHLVPDEFFDEQFINDRLLKSFTPNAKVTLFGKADNSYYYKGILQNLFFAMLNSPITPEGKNTISERRFRNGRGDYDNNKLMRHEELFEDPDLFVELANKYVPFLNGGLFDCLDDKDKDIYIDAFTDREAVAKQLIVPDYLFFGEDVGNGIDLSEWYGDKKKKKVSARGIIDILKRYNFTVEENTPFDQEVSLDPELLGKVFENLLAAYNPETQTTARKQTGSFYTPREIVQYMVDESLVAHLKRTVGEDLEPEYRKLVQYTDEELNLTDDQKRQIMQSLYECKVLDPACGSGAFPMGMLQQMVHILGKLDPNNEQWKKMMLDNAINETSEAYRNATDEERAEVIADIERSFNESVNRPDYARKLYLIENCIYGVDIQPIAIQISKLRFFISLVVDQKTNNDPVDNFGIRPLPNLEAKFVAANTLIGLEKQEIDIFATDAIRAKENELKDAKHRIFSAKTVKTKRKYKDRVAKLREELAKMLEDMRVVGDVEAKKMASWDLFDQNTSSPFFDSEWMFGVSNGFDVVIGNPPYVDAKDQLKKLELKKQREKLSKDKRFCTLYQKWDLYIAFMEIGIRYLCAPKSIFSMIVPYPLTNQLYAKKMREMIVSDYSLFELVDLNGTKVFENATVSNCIPFIYTSTSLNKKTIISNINKSKKIYPAFEQEFSKLIQNKNTAVWNVTQEERESNRYKKLYVFGDFCYISKGMVLNADEKKAKGEFKKSDLISSVKDSIHCAEYIEGKDIEKYRIKRVRFLEYGTKRCPGEVSRPTFPELYNRPKILTNKIGELMAICDENGILCDQTNRICIKWTDLKGIENKSIANSVKKYSTMKRKEMEILSASVNLYYLLGVLNSKYANRLLDDIRGVGNIDVNPEYIRNIPIPQATSEQQRPIIKLVERVLDAKKNEQNADTSSLEQQIDLLVYHLYSLTYDEVLIVDPETLITREEYEIK